MGEGGELSPWSRPLPSPGLAASPGSLLWHRCPRTHSWNWPAQAAQGFFPPPPFPLPSPHPRFNFSFLLQNQNTALTSSGAAAKWQEPAAEGLGHGSCPGPRRPGAEDTSRPPNPHPTPRRALLGTAEFGLSPTVLKCHCLGLQGTGVQGGSQGTGLCLPLPHGRARGCYHG